MTTSLIRRSIQPYTARSPGKELIWLGSTREFASEISLDVERSLRQWHSAASPVDLWLFAAPLLSTAEE